MGLSNYAQACFEKWSKMKLINYFRGIYLSQYILMAGLMTQIVPYLTHLGYDSIQRGWLLASYSFTTIFFQVYVGYLCDKKRRVKMFYVAVIVGLAIFSSLFFFITKRIFFLHLILLALAGGLCNTSTVVVDNWVISNKNARGQFSGVKAVGSLGWGISSILLPLLVSGTHFAMLTYIISGITLLLLFLSSRIKEDDVRNEIHSVEISKEDVIKLVRNNQYVAFSFVFFLIYLTIVANNTLIIDKILSFPTGNRFVGMKWAIQSFCEVPAYFLLNRFSKKIKNEWLIYLACLALIAQFGIYYFAGSVGIIVAASFLQIFTVPLFSLGSRMMIHKVTPEKLLSTGQLLSISFYMGMASFLSPLFSGFVSEHIHVNAAIATFIIFPVGAAFVLKITSLKYGGFKREHGSPVNELADR